MELCIVEQPVVSVELTANVMQPLNDLPIEGYSPVIQKYVCYFTTIYVSLHWHQISCGVHLHS